LVRSPGADAISGGQRFIVGLGVARRGRGGGRTVGRAGPLASRPSATPAAAAPPARAPPWPPVLRGAVAVVSFSAGILGAGGRLASFLVVVDPAVDGAQFLVVEAPAKPPRIGVTRPAVVPRGGGTFLACGAAVVPLAPVVSGSCTPVSTATVST
jgi:hypothetical protein